MNLQTLHAPELHSDNISPRYLDLDCQEQALGKSENINNLNHQPDKVQYRDIPAVTGEFLASLPKKSFSEIITRGTVINPAIHIQKAPHKYKIRRRPTYIGNGIRGHIIMTIC